MVNNNNTAAAMLVAHTIFFLLKIEITFVLEAIASVETSKLFK